MIFPLSVNLECIKLEIAANQRLGNLLVNEHQTNWRNQHCFYFQYGSFNYKWIVWRSYDLNETANPGSAFQDATSNRQSEHDFNWASFHAASIAIQTLVPSVRASSHSWSQWIFSQKLAFHREQGKGKICCSWFSSRCLPLLPTGKGWSHPFCLQVVDFALFNRWYVPYKPPTLTFLVWIFNSRWYLVNLMLQIY